MCEDTRVVRVDVAVFLITCARKYDGFTSIHNEFEAWVMEHAASS